MPGSCTMLLVHVAGAICKTKLEKHWSRKVEQGVGLVDPLQPYVSMSLSFCGSCCVPCLTLGPHKSAQSPGYAYSL